MYISAQIIFLARLQIWEMEDGALKFWALNAAKHKDITPEARQATYQLKQHM
jgi:hypothetical protein